MRFEWGFHKGYTDAMESHADRFYRYVSAHELNELWALLADARVSRIEATAKHGTESYEVGFAYGEIRTLCLALDHVGAYWSGY